MKKKLLFTFLILSVCFIVTGCGATNLNQTVEIKDDNIKITVLGSENETIKEDSPIKSMKDGEYTKVKISIENTGTETYHVVSYDFKLGGETSVITVNNFEDVPAGETKTGYIYFNKTDDTNLIYQKVGKDAYIFKIK